MEYGKKLWLLGDGYWDSHSNGIFVSHESICVLKLCKIKPIDKKAIEFAMGFDKIHFFEEGILAGGIGETFDYELTKIGYTGLYKVTAIEDRFVQHSSVADALKDNHLDADSMYEIMKND